MNMRSRGHCISGFIFFLFLYPDMPIETARFYNRYFLLLMFLVEAISYYHRTRGMRHASQ